MAHGNHSRGISQQVEPLGITPRIQIVHRLAFDRPTSLAVTKSGNRSRRAQQNRDTSASAPETSRAECHGRSMPQADVSPVRGGSAADHSRNCFNIGTQVVLTSAEHGAISIPPAVTKNLLPQHARFLETFGTKRLNLKSRAPQGICGGNHGRASFRRHRRAAIIFEIADAQLLSLRVRSASERAPARRKCHRHPDPASPQTTPSSPRRCAPSDRPLRSAQTARRTRESVQSRECARELV